MFQTTDSQFGDIKYSGISKAKVIDNIDPDSKGRIRVLTPIFGESNWIPYLMPAGMYSVPEKGDIVYVTTDGGWHNYLVSFGNLTSGPDNETLPASFKRLYSSNRGMYSKGGHLLELDDGTTLVKTGSGIRLTTAEGSKIQINEDPTAPGIIIERSQGQKILIDSLADKVEFNAAFGDKISISATEGIQGTTPTGANFSFKNGEVKLFNNTANATISSTGDISVKGPTVEIKSTASGDAEIKGPVGSMKIGADGKIEAKNATASLILDATGKVELKGAAAGVVELIQEFAQTLSTDVFAGFGAPAGAAAKYAEIAAKAAALKAT